MKNYTITVNGNVYDVTVEEKNGASVSAPVSAPKAPVAASPIVSNKTEAPVSSGSVTIVSPLAGKVLSYKAKPGDAVKKGQVVVIVEAMKMENEIVSPEDGVVAGLSCNEGAAVEAGAVLMTLK